MSGNITDLKADSSDAGESKPLKALLSVAAGAGSEILYSPEHSITDSSPSASVPLHSPSFTSSPSATMASSEVSNFRWMSLPDEVSLNHTHIFTIALTGLFQW